MVDGAWIADDALAATGDGAWQRPPSVVRRWIGTDDLPVVAGRYHLYAAWNCPWAHRVLLTRTLMGLQGVIPVSYAAPRRTDAGWVFDPAAGYVDGVNGFAALHQVYAAGEPGYTGRVTVPLIWDTRHGRLVSNESADIVRMLTDGFRGLATRDIDLLPADRVPAIDAWNDRIHKTLNNGVYRAGFAESQDAYEVAVAEVFDTLDAIEAQLSDTAYLTGDGPTEADVRLFPTLARFDVAYHTAFKCSRRRIADYPRLWRYARTFYALPGVADTVKFDVYRRGYFSRSAKRNPLGIVPVAPDISWAI